MIPVIFHNLSGYYGHFIIKALEIAGTVQLLSVNEEKYRSFTKYIVGIKIIFLLLYSFRFMVSSLNRLSSYLNHHKNICLRAFLNIKGTLSFGRENEFSLILMTGKIRGGQNTTKKSFFTNFENNLIKTGDYQQLVKYWIDL